MKGDNDGGEPAPREVNNFFEAQPKVEQADPLHDFMNKLSPDQLLKDVADASKRGGTSNDADKLLGTVALDNAAKAQDNKYMATTKLLEKTEGTEPYKPTETVMFDQVRQHFAQQVQSLNNFNPKIANA